MPGWKIARDDPARPEVAAVIAAHLAQMRAQTPSEMVFALPIEALRAPEIWFYSLSLDQVVGVGAIRLLADGTGELKSMHILAAYRGRGLGEAMVLHLMQQARRNRLARLYLETGAGEAHASARRLYAKVGFSECRAFADYSDDPRSFFMRHQIGSA